MERRKVEVESWLPPAVVCGILRRTAANSASNNNSVQRPIAVSDGTAARHKQMQPPTPHPTPGPASRPSPPDLVPSRSSLLRHSRRVHLPTSRPIDGVAENNQMGSSAGCRQLFQPRKRNTCAVMSSSTFCQTYSHRLTNGWTDAETDGRQTEGDWSSISTCSWHQVYGAWKLPQINFVV